MVMGRQDGAGTMGDQMEIGRCKRRIDSGGTPMEHCPMLNHGVTHGFTGTSMLGRPSTCTPALHCNC